MDSRAAVPWLKIWLAEQGLGARGFDLGFCQFSFRDLVSPAPKSQYDWNIFKAIYDEKPTAIQAKSIGATRPTKLLPGDSKTVPFLSITASCPLLFYQKWWHSKGIQPKLGTLFVYLPVTVDISDFAISHKIHVSLGAYLDVRANRVTIKYKRGLWERVGVPSDRFINISVGIFFFIDFLFCFIIIYRA